MGIAQAAIGGGLTLISKFLSLKSWTLLNLDTGEALQGQFPAEAVTRNVRSNYATTSTLNRQNPVLQFVSGELDTITFTSRFWRKSLLDKAPTDRIDTLIEWARVDSKLRRPPIITFSLGDGLGLTQRCVITDISNIVYGQPNALGGIREVSFQMSLSAQVPFDIDEQEVTDTRYARGREGDYYELLAAKEYNAPLLGVVIRRLHETKPIMSVGDVVKLPAVEGVRTAKIEPQSIAFKTAFGNRDTAQRRNRIAHFELRSGSARTFIFKS